MLSKCQNSFIKGCSLLLLFSLCAWSYEDSFSDAEYVKQCLQRCFNISGENTRLKKWEFQVTSEGFFRMRKYFPNGKQEYFAFNLTRVREMDFLGTEEAGTLLLQTKGEDIIVQTYNDPKGNIDSMTAVLKIPLKNINTDQLNRLYSYFAYRRN